MSILQPAAQQHLAQCLQRSSAAREAGEIDTMWQLLEDAHVLSQPSASAHIRVHYRMLLAAWSTRDRSEIRGQLTRLVVAGPGSWSGRYPTGNTGRANVSATRPMPIRPDLQVLLEP